MGAKTLNDVELMFEETPLKKVGRKPTHVTKRKALKQAKNGLQSYSSWQLVKELLRRHNMNLQVIGFWLALGFIIWQKLG